METNDYLELLYKKFQKHFVIELNTKIVDKDVDMLAKCNLILGRTFLSKNDIVDRYESNEYVVVKTYADASEKDVVNFLQYIKKLPSALVTPHKEHKNSYINAVMVCSNIDSQIASSHFTKFKYSEFYKFYLYGFCEIRAILVNLKDTSVITNRAGKQLKKVYLPTP